MNCQKELMDDVVHVWRANLKITAEQLSAFRQTLSAEEMHRADRLIRVEHRERYIASHGILRAILSKYLIEDSANFIFNKGPHGKPYLAGAQAGKLQFNMSDSQDRAIYAFAKNKEVGIDIEFMTKNVKELEIAQRFFSNDEYQALLASPPEERKQKFYRYWACKEAYIKLIGEGLSFPLKQFIVNLEDRANCLLSVKGDVQLAKNWTVRNLEVGNEYAAALGVEGKVREICYWEWEEGSAD